MKPKKTLTLLQNYCIFPVPCPKKYLKFIKTLYVPQKAIIKTCIMIHKKRYMATLMKILKKLQLLEGGREKKEKNPQWPKNKQLR